MSVEQWPLSGRVKKALTQGGYLTIEDFHGKTLDDIKEIAGLGPKGSVELREYVHSKFGIVFKKKKVEKDVAEKALYKDCKAVVEHFLKHNKFILWGKEIKAAKTLLSKYTKDELLKTPVYYKTSTLLFFLTKDGSNYINKYLPKKVELVEKTEVEQIIVPTADETFLKSERVKPKTLKDFFA